MNPSSPRSSIFAIERPHPNLMKLYILRSLVFPPFSLLMLPFLYFRYHTMRYRFDEEGVSQRWGILFRREVSLSYARLQDIHLTSGILQRWLDLADVHLQTASGSSRAEMVVEGLLEFEEVRDFLYSKMRGKRRRGSEAAVAASVETPKEDGLAFALSTVAEELRRTREVLAKLEARLPVSEDGDAE